MTDDTQRQATPRDDIPRHVATSGATYSLSPEAVVDRLARAGVPRDLRTVQRWCKRGALDCRRDDIAGYFISDLSLLRKITELQQLMELQARRDTTRPTTTWRRQTMARLQQRQRATRRGRARQATTRR